MLAVPGLELGAHRVGASMKRSANGGMSCRALDADSATTGNSVGSGGACSNSR